MSLPVTGTSTGLRCWWPCAKENPVAYLTVAAKFVPREMLLQLERPVEQLSDADLSAAAKAERDTSVLVLAKVRELPGGDDLVAEAERDVFDEDKDDE